MESALKDEVLVKDAVDESADAKAAVEVAEALEDVALNPHKEALLKELSRWQLELGELSKLLLAAEEDAVLSDLLYKSQCVVTALDREAVYLSHLSQVMAERLKSTEVAKDDKPAD